MNRALINNLAWLVGDSVALKLVGLGVTAFVARQLGPEQFGHLSYVLSTTALFAVIGHLGLQGLIQRELVQHPDDEAETLGTVAGLKLGTTLLGALLLLLFGIINPIHTPVEKQLFVLMSFAILVQAPTAVLATWFHARTRSKLAVVANQIGAMGAAIGKFLLVALGAKVFALGAAHTAGIALTAAATWFFFVRDGGSAIRTWRFDVPRARALLSECWMIFLGAIFATIYLKIDLVMLREMAGPSETGVYALAAMLSEASWFIPAAIVTTLFPRLVRSSSTDATTFNDHLQELYDILAVCGLLVMAATWLLGPLLLNLFFDQAYDGVIAIMFVHSLSLPFIFMRQGFSRWILVSRMARFSLLTQGSGAALNIALNLWLIPTMGGMGAAIATAVSYAGASYLSLTLCTQTRGNFRSMTIALLQPWRSFKTIISLFYRLREDR